jgi:hypothetical protein
MRFLRLKRDAVFANNIIHHHHHKNIVLFGLEYNTLPERASAQNFSKGETDARLKINEGGAFISVSSF